MTRKSVVLRTMSWLEKHVKFATRGEPASAARDKMVGVSFISAAVLVQVCWLAILAFGLGWLFGIS